MEEEREEVMEIVRIPRRKVSLKLIVNLSLRKVCYKKRRAGFLKKMYEITTLCNIEGCAIMYGPGDTAPTVWPSPEVARTLIQRFQSTPLSHRSKRSTDHLLYIQEKNKKLQLHLIKLREDIEQKEMSIFMHQICIEGKPLSQFSVNDLKRVFRYVGEKLRMIRMRISHYERHKLLSSNGSDAPPLPITCPQDNVVNNDDADQIINNNNNNSGLELIPTNTYWGGGIGGDNELVQGNASSGFTYELPQTDFGGLIGGSDMMTVLSHGNFGGFNGEVGEFGFFSPQGNFFGDVSAEVDDLMVLPQGNFGALNCVEKSSMGLPHNNNNVNVGGINGEPNSGILHGGCISAIGGSTTWMPEGHIGSTIGDKGMGIEQHIQDYGGPINITGLQQCHPQSNFGINNAMGDFNANFASSSSRRYPYNELLSHETFPNSSGQGSDFGMPSSSFKWNFP